MLSTWKMLHVFSDQYAAWVFRPMASKPARAHVLESATVIEARFSFVMLLATKPGVSASTSMPSEDTSLRTALEKARLNA